MILCLMPLNMSSLMDINEFEKKIGYSELDFNDRIIKEQGCFSCGSKLEYVSTIFIDNNKYFVCFDSGCIYLSALDHIRMGHVITIFDHHCILIKYLLSHNCEKVAETDSVVQIRQVPMVKKAYKSLFISSTLLFNPSLYSSISF